MTAALGAPDPFFEIESAHAAFEIFELASPRIGSGRPPGPRNQLWGSIVILARTSLEEALRRIHRHVCENAVCKYAQPQLDPGKFELWLKDHGRELPPAIPEELHISLRQKNAAKAGQGSGSFVNGPIRSEDMLELLAGLNHIRNGFAHRDPKKTETLPPFGSGVLWVLPENGTKWTVQMPHAFSAMRFCHTVFRFAVHACWGADVAVTCRSGLPMLLEDRLRSGTLDDPARLTAQLTQHLWGNDLRAALKSIQALELSIRTHHARDASSNQPALVTATAVDRPIVLADAIEPDRSGRPELSDMRAAEVSLFDDPPGPSDP